MKQLQLDYTKPPLTAVPHYHNDKVPLLHDTIRDLPLYKDISPELDLKMRQLVCDLCKQFYLEGWLSGTGGSICIRHGEAIFMTPSGVQKERINPDELYILDRNGKVLSSPPAKKNFIPKCVFAKYIIYVKRFCY